MYPLREMRFGDFPRNQIEGKIIRPFLFFLVAIFLVIREECRGRSGRTDERETATLPSSFILHPFFLTTRGSRLAPVSRSGQFPAPCRPIRDRCSFRLR